MNKVAVIISPNWKDYAEKYLADCLASLRAQTYQDFSLFLIDNESSDESLAYLKTTASEANVISLKKNEGFAGGNNAALRVALEKNFTYAFLINMDALAAPDCLEKLVAYAETNSVAAIQPRIMLWPEKNLLNSLGNETHFLGFGFCRAYRREFKVSDNEIKPISYASGAGVLFRLSALKKIGLFDEELWMYNEDQDICLRLWSSGERCLILPAAVVYHKYEFGRSIAKFYWMDRNRIIVILKNFHILTLLAILPAFIIMELGLILFSLKSGWFKEKLKVWSYFLSLKNWAYLIRERRRIQSQRVVAERILSRLWAGRIWYQEIYDAKLRLINPLFALYWRLVRLIMFW